MCGQRHGLTLVILKSGTDEVRIGDKLIFPPKKNPCDK
jgi:hypothetical protein